MRDLCERKKRKNWRTFIVASRERQEDRDREKERERKRERKRERDLKIDRHIYMEIF